MKTEKVKVITEDDQKAMDILASNGLSHYDLSWWLPSGFVKIAIENGPIEIVDLPSKNGDFPSLCDCLPEGNHRVTHVGVYLDMQAPRKMRWQTSDKFVQQLNRKCDQKTHVQ